MKIAYIGAGAAGRYCGACLHDNTLVTAVRAAGHDAVLVPTFTPIRTDEENVSLPRVFFGGVNVYLQQKTALFRYTPWFLDRLLDSPALLNCLSRRASGMQARELGALTVSTLQAEQGRQSKELEKLVRWLETDFPPEVVHLSNSMLCGMARELKRRLDVPVVCSLLGEDIFLEQLVEPDYSQVRALLRERARDVDVFVALNRYFADFMAEYLAVDRNRVEVIPHGLNLAGHGDKAESRKRKAEDTQRHEFVIGYFARIAPEKGLHYLVEAFELLRQRADLPPLRLKVAGYMSRGDRPYFDTVRNRVRELGWEQQFDFAGELNRSGKISFLQSLDVMSVPTIYRESKGLSVLEALANGVPVVVPNHGDFPEMIAETQGGLLVEPEDPQALADGLAALIRDPHRAAELGRRGQQAIHERFHATAMAERTIALYERLRAAHSK